MSDASNSTGFFTVDNKELGQKKDTIRTGALRITGLNDGGTQVEHAIISHAGIIAQGNEPRCNTLDADGIPREAIIMSVTLDNAGQIIPNSTTYTVETIVIDNNYTSLKLAAEGDILKKQALANAAKALSTQRPELYAKKNLGAEHSFALEEMMKEHLATHARALGIPQAGGVKKRHETHVPTHLTHFVGENSTPALLSRLNNQNLTHAHKNGGQFLTQEELNFGELYLGLRDILGDQFDKLGNTYNASDFILNANSESITASIPQIRRRFSKDIAKGGSGLNHTITIADNQVELAVIKPNNGSRITFVANIAGNTPQARIDALEKCILSVYIDRPNLASNLGSELKEKNLQTIVNVDDFPLIPFRRAVEFSKDNRQNTPGVTKKSKDIVEIIRHAFAAEQEVSRESGVIIGDFSKLAGSVLQAIQLYIAGDAGQETGQQTESGKTKAIFEGMIDNLSAWAGGTLPLPITTHVANGLREIIPVAGRIGISPQHIKNFQALVNVFDGYQQYVKDKYPDTGIVEGHLRIGTDTRRDIQNHLDTAAASQNTAKLEGNQQQTLAGHTKKLDERGKQER